MTEYTLITGATSGIGYALAVEFAKRGQALLLASRNLPKMRAVQKALQAKYKIPVIPVPSDLSKPDAPQKLYNYCRKNKLSIVTLVNNSGFGLTARPQVDQNWAECERLFQVNLHAVLQLSTLFGRDMKKRRRGYILNVASTAAFQPMPYAALYGASKAFVLALSEAMHIELQDYGVGVTALCPGITDTNFFKNGKPTVPGWLYKLVSPELVARRAVKALYQKKIYIVPYFQHWLIAQFSRFGTRKTIARIMRRIEKMRKKIRFL
ncbi:short-chain dehydrogenase [Candidatus Termititenax aidoneus]|uniref:Short-chain dehydrogenase n=1 Tax=Termititenax aidoneus TaxID=2218524 RepID=A0A388TCW8_TERA1|nr:short-chain dehydrogenase [Candidatus Termititenax aidoneus]